MRILKNFPEDERLRAAIVIPSYDEGIGLLKILHAWTMQIITSGVKTAIFMVVNNPKKASRQVRESNKQSIGLIEGIIYESPSVNQYAPIENAEEFLHMVRVIRTVRVRLCLIDYASKNYAPRDCNVGFARDAGFHQALKHLDAGDIVIGSDADSFPLGEYLSNAERYMREHPNVDALSGKVLLEDDPEMNNALRLYYLGHKVEELMTLITETYSHMQPVNRFNYLSGSNMVVRVKSFLEAGGFPHRNGAEDTELARKIIKNGGAINALPKELQIQTSSRPSERTEEGHGMGHSILKAIQSQHQAWSMECPSFQALILERGILNTIATLNQKDPGNETIWKAEIQNFLRDVANIDLKPEQINRLWEVNQLDPELKDTNFNRVLVKEVKEIVRTHLPLSDLMTELSNIDIYVQAEERERPDRISVPSTKGLKKCVSPVLFVDQALMVCDLLIGVLNERKTRDQVSERSKEISCVITCLQQSYPGKHEELITEMEYFCLLASQYDALNQSLKLLGREERQQILENAGIMHLGDRPSKASLVEERNTVFDTMELCYARIIHRCEQVFGKEPV